MRYAWRWLALFVCMFVVAVIFLWNTSVIQWPGQAVSNTEPSYDGKPASYWTARMHEYIETTECWAIEPGAKRYRHNLGEVKLAHLLDQVPDHLSIATILDFCREMLHRRHMTSP